MVPRGTNDDISQACTGLHRTNPTESQMFDLKAVLAKLLERLRRRWRWPLVGVAIAIVLALAVLWTRTLEYDISMIVGPVTPPGQAAGGSFATGAAASLLGLNAGSPSLDKYQQLLTSSNLAEGLSHNHAFFQEYFSGEWDSATHSWHPPRGALAAVRRTISQMLGAKPWEPPTAARLQSELDKNLIFSPVGRSSLLRVSLRTKDPEGGVRLLNTLNAQADTLLREMERTRVNAYLNYLDTELPNVQNAANRAALANLILEEQRQLMSLNSKTVSFSTQLIEPPSVPYAPLNMRPLPLMALSILLGLLAGLGLAYWAPDSIRVLG